MPSYMVTYDHDQWIVGAKNFSETISLWLEAMKDEWGDDWNGDEEPESVCYLSQNDVIVAR